MSWFKITFPLEQAGVNGEVKRLQDAFEVVLIASGGAQDAAMFGTRSDDFKNYFCYFSPGAIRIASGMLKAYSPVECPAPADGEVSLLAGDVRAFDLLSRSR